MTSTAPSTTLTAVLSPMAYVGTGMPDAHDGSRPARPDRRIQEGRYSTSPPQTKRASACRAAGTQFSGRMVGSRSTSAAEMLGLQMPDDVRRNVMTSALLEPPPRLAHRSDTSPHRPPAVVRPSTTPEAGDVTGEFDGRLSAGWPAAVVVPQSHTAGAHRISR